MDGNLLKEAHKLADSNHLELEFLQGNIYDLPFYEEFDLVYCRFLFQHLSDPFKALENLYKALRPGGRLCITDVDDGWLSIYPEVPAFNHICQKACEIQSISGGDRLIGRKLHSYLKSSGFSDIKVDVIPVNSDQIGIKDFLNITTQFKKELLIKSGDHASQKYFDEVWEAAYSQELFGIVGAFVVSGLKA